MGPLCHGLGNEGMRCCQLRYEVFYFFFFKLLKLPGAGYLDIPRVFVNKYPAPAPGTRVPTVFPSFSEPVNARIRFLGRLYPVQIYTHSKRHVLVYGFRNNTEQQSTVCKYLAFPLILTVRLANVNQRGGQAFRRLSRSSVKFRVLVEFSKLVHKLRMNDSIKFKYINLKCTYMVVLYY
jgi:hypothetical protein